MQAADEKWVGRQQVLATSVWIEWVRLRIKSFWATNWHRAADKSLVTLFEQNDDAKCDLL